MMDSKEPFRRSVRETLKVENEDEKETWEAFVGLFLNPVQKERSSSRRNRSKKQTLNQPATKPCSLTAPSEPEPFKFWFCTIKGFCETAPEHCLELRAQTFW